MLAAKGAANIGAVGFCWGAYPVFSLSGDGLLKAGVSCHPSLKIGEMMFQQSIESQVQQRPAARSALLLCLALHCPARSAAPGLQSAALP